MSADEILRGKLERAAADLAPEDQTLEQARNTAKLRGDSTYLARWINHHAATETVEQFVADARDLRPKGRSDDDRRQTPRRSSEIALHLSEQLLLSHACMYVDLLLDPNVDDGDDRLLDSVAELARAVTSFREAADAVHAPRVR